MLFITDAEVKKLVRTELERLFVETKLAKLDPAKHYILVIPTDIDEDTVQQAFENFTGTNLVILRADSVKLLEF